MQNLTNHLKKHKKFLIPIALLATTLVINSLKQIPKKRKQRFLLNRAQKHGKEVAQKNQSIEITLSQNVTPQLIEKVLNSDVSGLKQMLEKKEITSVDLLNIFVQRTQKIAQELNLITEITYKEALEQAKKCDELRQSHPELCKGHLFGIPISIKDMVLQKGYISYVGRAAVIDTQPAERDGFNLHLLKQQGAIPFVRSNVPQCGLTIESANYIFGRAQNPWDRTKSTGGSSGGEGALIASRCSPLGFGTDLGGSIRIPASFCGVYGFKPTSNRGIAEGHVYYNKIFNGQTTVKVSCGPLGKSVEDLTLLFRCLCERQIAEKEDIDYRNIYQVVKEFDEQSYQRKDKIRIGYFKTLAPFDSTLTNQRAVQIAIDKARELGHEVVEIELPQQYEIEETTFKILFGDGFDGIRMMVDGEQLIEEYQALDTLTTMNPLLRSILQYLQKLLGEQRIWNTFEYTKKISAIDFQIQCDRVLKIRNEYLQLFKKQGIEAVICPTSAIPSLNHTMNGQLITSLIYCYIWNIADFPCGVIPVCKVEENELNYDNCRHNDAVAKLLKQQLRYSKGMPVGVQIVGLPNQDEFVLNLMKQIDEKIAFYKNNDFPQV